MPVVVSPLRVTTDLRSLGLPAPSARRTRPRARPPRKRTRVVNSRYELLAPQGLPEIV